MNKISAIILVLLIVGCSATGPTFKPESTSNGENATVYIYRPFQYFNAGGWPKIYVNGKEKFSLKNNGYGTVRLKPGTHVIKAEGSMLFTNWYPEPASIKLSAEANKIYYIRVTPQHDSTYATGATVSLTGSAQVVLVTASAAKKEISKTKKVF
jgi:hypothetical protein